MVPLVVALFFIWGFLTVLNDSLIPKLKALFALSYAEVMLTQFAFFISYFVFSMPAAGLLARIGYLRAIVAGLLVTTAGGLMFAPAAYFGLYPMFLVALFIMGGGITMLQVAANPLISNLGDQESASSRLTLAQAFNSLATTVGPRVGAAYIIGSLQSSPDLTTTAPDILAAFRQTQAHAIQGPYLVIAVVLVILAAIFWRYRNATVVPAAERIGGQLSLLELLKAHPSVSLGALSIFIYVGCEVTIGSFMTNYLMQPRTLGLVASDAAGLVSFYWGGAMVGRFIGSYFLSKGSPGLILAGCAVAASLLTVTSATSSGWMSAGSLIAIGLANSIMFPTIFSLAIAGLGAETPRASGLICMAIVGGAVIPPLAGIVADHFGLATAILMPAVLYLWIAYYGVISRGRAVGTV
jgi:FHS family L-fucose permease-like MFS transporter